MRELVGDRPASCFPEDSRSMHWPPSAITGTSTR
jgi:hypothetical protein